MRLDNTLRSARATQGKRDFLATYKAQRGCAECGECDPDILDLDHIKPEEKNRRLKRYHSSSGQVYSGMAWCYLTWDELFEELAKVQVLCANHHRKKTVEENRLRRNEEVFA